MNVIIIFLQNSYIFIIDINTKNEVVNMAAFDQMPRLSSLNCKLRKYGSRFRFRFNFWIDPGFKGVTGMVDMLQFFFYKQKEHW